MQNKDQDQHKPVSGEAEKKTGATGLLDPYTVQPRQENDKSPYYKNDVPVISLPKGGGAIKGIDEKFTVNSANGSASLGINLPLSSGRGGFTPALGLNYNSGNGNSEFGQGWNLSLPAIQRRTDKKLPLYNDAEESDVFLLAGAEDLVSEMDTTGKIIVLELSGYVIKRYRPRTEGLFARIEHIVKKGESGSWWRVTTKENITTYYGMRPASRIADPENASRIFKWLPDMSLDHKGNVHLFSYVPENFSNVVNGSYEYNRANGKAAFANTYFKRVQYGNDVPYFIPAEKVWFPDLPLRNWLFEAVMDYGDHSKQNYTTAADGSWSARIDAFSDFHAGFELRTYRLCKRVLMFHRFKELNNGNATLVRSLDLAYKNDNSTEAAAETDYIISATQSGYTQHADLTYSSKSLPALKLKYSPFRWNTNIEKVDQESFTGAPQGLTGPYQWTDFEGEGISGILTEQGNGWFYKSNLGNGHFSAPKTIASRPSFSGLGNGLKWQDLDADGRRQVVSELPVKGFWELDDKQSWQPFQTFDKNLDIDWDNPFTKMLDLDGDGRADALITEDRAWTWYGNLGKEGFEKGGNARVFTDEENGPSLLLRDAVQSIFIADMNGDGMTDLVRITNGEVCYWPNMGYGKFGAKVAMGNAPTFASPDQYNPAFISLADISGTGAADIIYTGNNSCKAWINLSGNAFSEAYDINPLPGTDAYSKIAVLDFLGNGTGCIVWSSPLPAHTTAPIQYIDLMGGQKPHLLECYYNGTGKSTSLHYKSSTQFYLEDKLQGIGWATKLPFPVHCVSKITTYDTVSRTKYSQEYRYRHGYYDHEEREFRGFGYVETIDTDAVIDQSPDVSPSTSLDQHPVKTKTWYHTGAWMRESDLLTAFSKEYFQLEDWGEAMNAVVIPGGLSAQEHREAYRALKGSALRQEIYALDKTEQQETPYAITITGYEIKKIQDQGKNRFASFLNIQQQNVVLNCEREIQDPRIVHNLTLDTDRYGNVLASAQVVYRRRAIPAALPGKVKDEQARMHITAVQNKFTGDAIDDVDYGFYRLRTAYEAKSYEVVVTHSDVEAGKLWTPGQLNEALHTAAEVDFAALPVSGQKRLLGHSRTRFLADDAATALPFGQLDSLGLLYESYQMAYTPEILNQTFGNRLNPVMLGSLNAGYVDLDNNGHYWVPSGKAIYSNPLSRFFTPEIFIDPWGNETQVTLWGDYWLLPESTTDAIGNVITAEVYNWRNLQPVRMKDINDNISEMLYDALGLPVAMAVKGKDAGTEGDELTGLDPESAGDRNDQAEFWDNPADKAEALLQNATWRCVYDLHSLPVATAMIARQHHVHGAVIPQGQDTKPILRFSYSDGMGRVLMHKVQASPLNTVPVTPRWIGNGRTIYNNKGNTVMQYEPYFSATHKCDTAEQAHAAGVSPRLFYDPLNRLRETKFPDGSYARTEWTAWVQTVWDNNDTVKTSDWYATRIQGGMGVQEQEAAQKAAAHDQTPSVMHTDTLARAFYSIQQDGINPAIHSYDNLDIQGNRLSICDGDAKVPLTHKYNMLQHPCMQSSRDSGTVHTLIDVAGQALFFWDADDRLTAISYDALRRPFSKKVDNGGITSLLEIIKYGEGQAFDKIKNLRGQVYEQCDGSGKQWVPEGYDFKGKPVKSYRALLSDPLVTDIDWASGPLVNTEYFVVTVTLDALGRPVQSIDPGNNLTVYLYDQGGALKKVILTPDSGTATEYIKDISHDAKGQRASILYGNNTLTHYTYDEETFRLRRLLTTSGNGSTVLQDLHYYYDPIGNITRITDNAQQTLFFANALVAPDLVYTYDALYRLIEAKGREQIGTADFGVADNSLDTPWSLSLGSDAVQAYTQKYTYNASGNILSLQHIAGTGSYTRSYAYNNTDNRLLSTSVNPYTYDYAYDARGNMVDMPHLNLLQWNVLNQLNKIEKGGTNAYYQYSGGQRLRKYVVSGSLTEERIYLGSFEIYRKFDGGSLKVERHTVHVSDDAGRIAMLETRKHGLPADDGNTEPELTRYIYANHLQSAALELDDTGRIISYEEYHPYGTTAFQALNSTIKAAAKRYRYTGKERDEESGLYYHGARYYIPWLCRWSAADPLELKYAGLSPYNYSFNNPVIFNDPSGMEGEDVVKYNRPDGKPIYLSKDAKPKIAKKGDEFVFYDDNLKPTDKSAASLFKEGDLYGFVDENGVTYHSNFKKNDQGEYVFSGYSDKDGNNYLEPEISTVTNEGNTRINESIAANSGTVLYNNLRRDQYKGEIKELSKQKVEAVRDARKLDNLEAAEKAAKEANRGRNDIRLKYQNKMTPAAQKFSEMIEQDRSWENMLRDKTAKHGDDMFETFEQIATSAGKSRNTRAMRWLNRGGKILGTAGVLLGTAWSIKEIADAPEGKRGEVAAHEAAGIIGSVLGGIAGSTAALAILAFAAALLAITPFGWVALTVALIGSLIGGYIFSKTLQNVIK